MSNQTWIGAMLIGSFFAYVTIRGSLARYVALILGQNPQPTPVTGVANLSSGNQPGVFGGGNWFPLGGGSSPAQASGGQGDGGNTTNLSGNSTPGQLGGGSWFPLSPNPGDLGGMTQGG